MSKRKHRRSNDVERSSDIPDNTSNSAPINLKLLDDQASPPEEVFASKEDYSESATQTDAQTPAEPNINPEEKNLVPEEPSLPLEEPDSSGVMGSYEDNTLLEDTSPPSEPTSPEDHLLSMEVAFLKEALSVRDAELVTVNQLIADQKKLVAQTSEELEQLAQRTQSLEIANAQLRASHEEATRLEFDLASLRNSHSIQIAEMLSTHERQMLDAIALADQRVDAVYKEISGLTLWQIERASSKRSIVVGRDALDATRRALNAASEESAGKITAVRSMNEKVII